MTRGVLQSAADFLITMLAGGKHTAINEDAAPYRMENPPGDGCPRVVTDFEDFLSTGEDKTGICICIPPIFTHFENRDIIYLKTF